jgi:uncharacterized iron-regulated membrane protein
MTREAKPDLPVKIAPWWRKWHRWIALPATLFLAFVAVTGVIVAWTEFFGAEEALREATRDLVSSVTLGEPLGQWSDKLNAALATVAAQAPGAPVDKITLQFKGEPTITIYTGKPTGGEDRKFVVDGNSGQIRETSSYADKPIWHRIHSGEAFGDGGLVAAMFWGTALAFLSVSGLMLYLSLWRRSRAGLRRYFW